MIKVTLAGLALVFLSVLREVVDEGQMTFKEVDVQLGLVLASGFVDRSCKAIRTQAVNFELHGKTSLGKFVKTQAFKVFFGHVSPLMIELRSWTIYASDFLSTMKSKTMKSSRIFLVKLAIISNF